MPIAEELDLEVEGPVAGRLDSWLSARLPGRSRAAVQRLIRSGLVTVDRRTVKPGAALRGGERVHVRIPIESPVELAPEPGLLDVLYQDTDLAVVAKPAGMVVHPSPGHRGGTLANVLLGRFDGLSHPEGPCPRPGIVHRLDRDTSGLLVVARHDRAHEALSRQFARRTVEKRYLALVDGEPPLEAGEVDLPIGRSRRHRQRMAVRHEGGREARTAWRVLERLGGFALLELAPRTGRTHQIRVHLAHEGWPILCDPAYGRRGRLYASEIDGRSREAGEPPVLDRTALHAAGLAFDHPDTGERLAFQAPLPVDMDRALALLRRRRQR